MHNQKKHGNWNEHLKKNQKRQYKWKLGNWTGKKKKNPDVNTTDTKTEEWAESKVGEI
jgi:1,4-alpha-glucan branching enzyme